MEKYSHIPVVIKFHEEILREGKELGTWYTYVGDCMLKFDKNSYIVKHIINEISSIFIDSCTKTDLETASRIHKFTPRVLELCREPVKNGNEKPRNYTDEECSYISTQPQKLTEFFDYTQVSTYNEVKTHTSDILPEILVDLCCKDMFVNERIISHIINCLNGFVENKHPLSSEEQISTLHLADVWMVK
jgi:hypothetical protein